MSHYDLYRKRVVLVGGPTPGRMVIIDGKEMAYTVEIPGDTYKDSTKRIDYWVTVSPFDWDNEGPIFVATTETPCNRDVKKTLLSEYRRLATKEPKE